jgi:hypothetical protein
MNLIGSCPFFQNNKIYEILLVYTPAMCHFRGWTYGREVCRWNGEPVCGWVTFGDYPCDPEGLIEAKAQEFLLTRLYGYNLHRVVRDVDLMGRPVYAVQECFMCPSLQ